jgi:hypothetical protein
MKRTIKEGVLPLIILVLVLISLICLVNGALGAGVVVFLVGIIYGVIVVRVIANKQLGHELSDLNKKFTSTEIMSDIKKTFDSSWKPNISHEGMSYSATYSRLGGLVNGPTVQVDLTDNGSVWSVDVWVSDFIVKNGTVKHGNKISKLRDRIDDVLIKYI